VGHVREELGLVPGRQVQLPGPFLEFLPGLLDLNVLDLDVPVLPGQLNGLVLQLGVGALQLVLPDLELPGAGLQLRGEPLRLGQQRVGPAMIVLTLTPMVSMSCSRKSWCTWVKREKEPASMTPRT